MTATDLSVSTEETTMMFSFTKLKRLYGIYKKEMSVAFEEEKARLMEERMTQRNPLRPWRKYNENEAHKYAMKKLKSYDSADKGICEQFDEIVNHFEEMERVENIKVANIEIDEWEHEIIEMFKEVHALRVARTLDGIDLSYHGDE